MPLIENLLASPIIYQNNLNDETGIIYYCVSGRCCINGLQQMGITNYIFFLMTLIDSLSLVSIYGQTSKNNNNKY